MPAPARKLQATAQELLVWAPRLRAEPRRGLAHVGGAPGAKGELFRRGSLPASSLPSPLW